MSFSYLASELSQQKDKHRLRKRQCVIESNDATILVDGKKYLNFSSNDYLGLNKHPGINQALQEGIDKFGASSCSSSLVTGFNYAHQTLENTICEWVNKPKCLLFNSGFSANQGVLHALSSDTTQFWLDKLSHASLIDGALLGKGKTKRFLHNNYKQLDSLLAKSVSNNLDKKSQTMNNLIVSEGVFSMDGDKADVEQLAELAKRHHAWLYLDDAHSIGVVGDKGQGSATFSNNINVIMATFGKALATSGAFIACDETLHDYLVNFSRHYIYSTAISPAIAWATNKSILISQNETWRREKISELSQLFVAILNKDIKITQSSSSIHAIVIGSEVKTLELAEKLKTLGIWVTAIRPPTVPNNTSRLRVTICANHKANDIRYLAESINKALL